MWQLVSKVARALGLALGLGVGDAVASEFWCCKRLMSIGYGNPLLDSNVNVWCMLFRRPSRISHIIALIVM